MADITAAKPFYSVLVLAFACSALVAGAAVGLRPKQEANRQLDRQKNILYAAGLYEENRPIEEMFRPIETRVVDLATGRYVERKEIDPATYNQLKAPLSSEYGKAIPDEADSARLGRQEKYSIVYVVRDNSDQLQQIILPVRGKGLWSTMFAYVSVNADLSTIRGVSFYQHGETPGLGGEIENRGWQDSWRGKRIYREDGSLGVQFAKGKADQSGANAPYQIDGLSGATLTTNGVEGMMEFWFGDHGFKPYFAQLKK